MEDIYIRNEAYPPLVVDNVVFFLLLSIYSLYEPCVSLYYSEKLISFDMVRLKGGTFTMG